MDELLLVEELVVDELVVVELVPDEDAAAFDSEDDDPPSLDFDPELAFESVR